MVRKRPESGQTGCVDDVSVWSWSFDPLQLLPLVLIGAAYWRRARTLGARGTPVARWRRVTFASGLLLAALALASPIDALGEERLFAAHMTEGADIADPATLVRLAAEIGLDVAEAESVLASGDYADAVRRDERRAREIGVTGVPFFVLDETFGMSGAQTPEVILAGLREAHAAPAERAPDAGPGGPSASGEAAA